MRDRLDLREHLALVYDEMGRGGEARQIREELEERLEAGQVVWDGELEEPEEPDGTEAIVLPEQGIVRLKTRQSFGPEGVPLDRLDDVRREAESRLLAERDRKIGRNERCPCGSGKKYKKCCGR